MIIDLYLDNNLNLKNRHIESKKANKIEPSLVFKSFFGEQRRMIGYKISSLVEVRISRLV